MKKCISIVLAALMMIVGALAEEVDFSGMSQSEILDVINAGRNAMAKNTVEGEILRYESEDGYTIIFTGISENSKKEKCYIEVLLINDMDINIKTYSEEIYVNGWGCHLTASTDVNAHRRASVKWFFKFADVGIASIEEIEDIEIYLRVFPEDGVYTKDAFGIDAPLILVLGGQ